MIWPELQYENLLAALFATSLGLAGMAWGRGQQPESGGRIRVEWGWLGGASLALTCTVILWLALAEQRLPAWPSWAGPMLGGISGTMAAMTMIAGWGPETQKRRSAGTNQAVCLVTGTSLGVALPTYACAGAGLSLVLLGAVLLLRKAPERGWHMLAGIGLAALGMGWAAMPPFAETLARSPSEAPLAWGDRSFLCLVSAVAGGQAACLGLRRRWPRRAGLALWGLVAALIVGASLWREHRLEPGRRECRRWLEKTAAQIGPDPAMDPADWETGAPMPVRLSRWRFESETPARDSEDWGAASAGVRTGMATGWLERGPYWREGRRWSAFFCRIPGGGADRGPWLKAEIDYGWWADHLRDSRPLAVVALLYGTAFLMVGLSAREWLRANRLLREQTLEALTTARVKTEMAGLLSHELRTPLQVILGHLELVRADATPDALRKTQAVVSAQGRQLLRLVNDTLDLCALEAGALLLRSQDYSPAAFAAELAREMRPLAAAKGLDLCLRLGTGLPERAQIDLVRLRQVVSNLLTNSIRYTPTGRVTLSLRREVAGEDREFLVYGVADTGPGLPAEVCRRLGEPFRPVASATGAGGTGLGLALVVRLCNRMGGNLRIDTSAAEGGAALEARFPLGPAPQHLPALATPGRTVDDTGQSLSGRRVLVVDDNALIREVLTGYLVAAGAIAEAVAGGMEAWAICESRPPDIVLLDLAMPGLDGSTLARQLRRLPSGDRLCIWGLSADASAGPAALAAGMDGFLPKPVTISDLVGNLASPGPSAGKTGELPPAVSGRLRELFKHETPALLKELKSAVDASDTATIRRLAHYLKNSADVLGAVELSLACATLGAVFDQPTPDQNQPACPAYLQVHTIACRLLDDPPSTKPCGRQEATAPGASV